MLKYLLFTIALSVTGQFAVDAGDSDPVILGLSLLGNMTADQVLVNQSVIMWSDIELAGNNSELYHAAEGIFEEEIKRTFETYGFGLIDAQVLKLEQARQNSVAAIFNSTVTIISIGSVNKTALEDSLNDLFSSLHLNYTLSFGNDANVEMTIKIVQIVVLEGPTAPEDGLSQGAIIAISITCSVAGLCIILSGTYLIYKRRIM